MLASLIHRFRGSVRLKLLALVLAPLVAGVPVLLALVWTWGSQAYERLLTYKVSSDLVTAHEYFDRVRAGVGRDVMSLAESGSVAAGTSLPIDQLTPLLGGLAERSGLDYLLLLDLHGRPVAGARVPIPEAARTQWPVVATALIGRPHTAIERFEPDELAAIDPALRARAAISLVPTQAAAPDSRAVEARGLFIQAAAPVRDSRGEQLGVLEAGVLLNGNLDLVDHINAIVYRDGTLPLGSRGTATLFLGDTRVATNVGLFDGQRALGTRVSQAVRTRVLDQGEVWLGTAFVVNDAYVSGYEPIVNGSGERVGMLYVGFLDAPLRAALRYAMVALCGMFIVISVIGTVVSLRWARGVFEPLERMNRVIQRVEQGDAAARIGPVASRDELGRLAGEFDDLLDTLSAKREELQRWADELDRKVAERTAELREANEILRRTQQQLVMSEKLAAIGELTAGVAHEVNNPVAVIQGNLDVLRDVLGEACEPVREEIRLIHEQSDRIRQIVTKLLQFARPGDFAGYTEVLDVNTVMSDCLVLTRHNLDRQKIAVVTRYEATQRVEINRSELQQVLINLIVNAVQAMPEGGRLTLSSSDHQAEDGGVAGVVIRVSDTGHGIAPEDLSTIFDPFFTTKKGSGTGLGLSISYTIVERYGGLITVSSTPGEGAAFEVRLRCEARFNPAPGAPGFMRRWKA